MRRRFESCSPSTGPNATRTANVGENTGSHAFPGTETLSEEGSFWFTVSLFRTLSDPQVHSAGRFGLALKPRRIRDSRQMLR